jgi:hypothetical protein
VWTRVASGEGASWTFNSNASFNSQFTALRITGATGATISATASGGTTTAARVHTAPTITGSSGDLLIVGWQIIAEATISQFLVESPMTQHHTFDAVTGTWLRHIVASQPLSQTGATGVRRMRTSLLPATYGDTSWALIVHSNAVVDSPVVTTDVEIEFVPGSGVFTTISSRCNTVHVSRPRPGVAEAVAPTVLTVELKNFPDTNGFCPFTPDNPGSIYYPNIAPDRQIRAIARSAGSSWYRFNGWVDKWIPDMSAGGSGQSTVTLTASDVLGRYARKRLLSYYGETVISKANVDYYPFDDPTDTATARGISGDPGNFPARDGIVVQPSRPPGAANFSAPDGGHLGDGQIEFSRGDDNAPAPVVLIRLRPGVDLRSISAAYKLTADPAGLTDDVLAGYDINGHRLWRWTASLSGGVIVWTLFDDANVARSSYSTLAPRDDAWHYWLIVFVSATSTNLFLREKGGVGNVGVGSTTWTEDPRPVAWLVVGGQMVPQRLGKQTNTLQGGVSSLVVQYASGTGFDYSEFTVPGIITSAERVASFLDNQGAELDGPTGGIVTAGADERPLMYTNSTRNLLDRWNEQVVTIGGHMSSFPDGRARYRNAEQIRPTIPALFIDAADDLDIPGGGWSAVKDERPTRVTAVGPVGSTTYVDTAAEALILQQLDGPTLQTSAGSIALARSVAASVVNPRAARLQQFGVHLSLCGTDKVAAFMGLLQSDRIRVSGLPSEYLGLTAQDVYASGWTETYSAAGQTALFVFDTDTADDPVEAILDDAEYSRIGIGDGAATVTGGTCVGVTGTGTVIITSTSVLTTVGGEYSLDLDWQGERITVSVPGGGTSPQTCTVTVRGVSPTVARVHAAGESVEVWHAARVAL